MQKTASVLAATVLCLGSASLHGEAIEDNSFLVEEAYNQEAGVVQFIQTYQKDKNGDAFYSLTVEIPAPNERHQISFLLPYTHLEGMPEDSSGVGDVGLNYRYQLFSNETLAIAPRLSVLLPSGDEKKGLGSGVIGLQTNWAASIKVNPSLALHLNVGATWLPQVENGSSTDDLYGSNAALSFVWLLQENFNLLVEYVSASMDTGAGVASTAIINPGCRYAVNFPDSQLVLGVSLPTPVLYSQGAASYLLYVSFEPKLW